MKTLLVLKGLQRIVNNGFEEPKGMNWLIAIQIQKIEANQMVDSKALLKIKMGLPQSPSQEL